jgi:hypothetical protein
VKQVKWDNANMAGDKHADGSDMTLLVTASGKYWRFDCRHLGGKKTLALGVYPDVSLLKARKRRDAAIADAVLGRVDLRLAQKTA